MPGDLIYIKPEEPQLLHCDAVIVEGSCSVDESMLTGESYPITKVADYNFNEIYSSNLNRSLLDRNTERSDDEFQLPRTQTSHFVLRYSTAAGAKRRQQHLPESCRYQNR